MKYQFWLTHNGGVEKIHFPVLPEALNIRIGGSNKSVSIQGLGEVSIMSDPSAKVFSFNSFLPATPFPGVQYSQLTAPVNIVNAIERWKNSGLPSHFIITGTDINLFCAIESFDYSERGGYVGTLHYSITLKEYKEVKARQVTVDIPARIAIAPPSTPERTDNRVSESTHTVVKGDTLWAISARYLGSGSRFMEIYNLNTNIISSPNLIFPGQVLRIM